MLLVVPHPDSVIDKQGCLQVFPCICLSQHSALKSLKGKRSQFQMHRKWIFLHRWLLLTLSWQCELRNYFCYPASETWWIWTSVMAQIFFLRELLILWKRTVEQHHRTAEEGGHLWGSSGTTPDPQKGQQELVAQRHVQLCFEYLQRQIFHNISRQLVQPPLQKKLLPDI